MAVQIIEAPAAEPISAADVVTQTHVRADFADDADLASTYIESARSDAESRTKRQFVTATLRLTLEAFPAGRYLEIPRPPLQSVTAVRYYDAAGTLQTLDPAVYHVSGAHPAPVLTEAPMPGVVTLKAGASWPTTEDRPDAVEVEFVAGYGEPADVPAGIKHAMLLHVADSYDQRGTLIVGTVSSQLARTFARMLDRYEVP